MHRIAARSTRAPPVLRAARKPASQPVPAAPRRFASTAASPADRPRSWKSSAARWGLAVGAVYYYSTSSVFADEVTASPPFSSPPPTFPAQEAELPTVDSVIQEKRRQNATNKEPVSTMDTSKFKNPDGPSSRQDDEAAVPSPSSTIATPSPTQSSPEALEEEAGQQGAFNPETGEINWDCPCLGGMADGPCGEQFKTAFSCFVYSTEEPKGMDCIEKFQGMQECFLEYPEIYGAELADEEDEDGADYGLAPESARTADHQDLPNARIPPDTKDAAKVTSRVPTGKTTTTNEPTGPKWEDATEANSKVDDKDASDNKKGEQSDKKPETKLEKKEPAK